MKYARWKFMECGGARDTTPTGAATAAQKLKTMMMATTATALRTQTAEKGSRCDDASNAS
jgi:hypothetical protein